MFNYVMGISYTDQMINKLEMLMQDATSKDKATIQRCIDELKRQ